MEKYFTYILQSKTKQRYYIGSCENIDERLARYNRGLVKSTKYGIPWEVVYTEEFTSRQEAFKREQEIKRYKGGGAFKKLLKLV